MTHVIGLNDTIILNDSVIGKIEKASNITLSHVNEISTNWADVEIVKFISLSIVLIVAILVIGFLLFKYYEAEKASEATKQKYKEDEKIREFKRKTELKDQKLAFLKAYCYTEVEDKKTKQVLIDKESPLVTEYIKELDS